MHRETHTWLAWVHYQQNRMWSLSGPQNNRILLVRIYWTQFCSATIIQYLFTRPWEPVPMRQRRCMECCCCCFCFDQLVNDLKASSPAAAQDKFSLRWWLFVSFPSNFFQPSPYHKQGWDLLVINLTGFLRGFAFLFVFLAAAFSPKNKQINESCI